MISNLRHAARNNEKVWIGGGEFSGAELTWAADMIESVPSLVRLLKEAQKLGLTFDIGSAYIRRSYINEQDYINKQINELLAKIGNTP